MPIFTQILEEVAPAPVIPYNFQSFVGVYSLSGTTSVSVFPSTSPSVLSMLLSSTSYLL